MRRRELGRIVIGALAGLIGLRPPQRGLAEATSGVDIARRFALDDPDRLWIHKPTATVGYYDEKGRPWARLSLCVRHPVTGRHLCYEREKRIRDWPGATRWSRGRATLEQLRTDAVAWLDEQGIRIT